jgi:hypothetical protein
MMATKKTITVDVWEAEGLTFDSERQALEYEQRRKDLRIAHNFHKMKLLYTLNYRLSDWMLIRNEAELEYFNRNFGSGNKTIITLNKKKLSLGDWVAKTIREDEDGNEYESGLVTLEYLLSKMEDFVEKAKELTVQGKY